MSFKSYTFKGTGDFSDFNQKAKEAASTMGGSFKSAYDEMLKSASTYSSSSKKQLDYLSNIFKEFKEQQTGSLDQMFDQLYQDTKVTEKGKISDLDTWRSSALSQDSISNEYKSRTGEKFDPYSQKSQNFKSAYSSEIENEYSLKRVGIQEETEGLRNGLDSLREQLDTSLEELSPKEYFSKLKELAREQVLEAKKQNRGIEEIVRELEDSENISDNLLASQLREEATSESRAAKRNRLEGEGSESNSIGFLKGLSNYSYLDKLTGVGTGLARSKNGSELFGELVTGVSAAGGGLSQLLMTGVGTAIGGPIGAAIGGGFSVIFGKAVEGATQIVGEAAKRTMDERESLSLGMNSYRSKTGSFQTFRDLSYQGIDFKTFVAEQNELASSQGRRVSNSAVEGSLSLQKGYGVDKGLILSVSEIQRNTNKDLVTTFGRILESGEGSIFKGGDRTFFSEFSGKFVELQREFLKTQTTVSDSTTLDILKMFNSVGGQFSANDYRSLGNIQSINSSLRTPGSDATKALSYKLISDRNPEMDMFDIQEEMQKGLSSPEYFKDRLRFLKDNYKDDPELLKMSIAQEFGLGDNLSGAKSIYNNLDKILGSNISSTDLSSKYGLGDFKDQALKSTTLLEQNQAKITNDFTQSAIEGMKSAGQALVDTVQQAFSGATFTVRNGEVTFSRTVVNNPLKLPGSSNSSSYRKPQNLGMGVWK